ncbi:MAG: hypothetical protein R3A78_10725 [Polyangiales bacterium]|nr:hypothetical protein [Myxococcales bacterium]
MPPSNTTPTTPKFCPFCRECFEDTDLCPDHELPLVAFGDLPRPAHVPDDDDALPPLPFGQGRTAAFVGACVLLVASVLPAAHLDGREPFSLIGAAAARVPNLWLVPCTAMATLVVLFRFRTRRRLRSARIAVVAMALFAAASLSLSAYRMIGSARVERLDLHADVGVFLAVFGVLVLGYGALTLGRAP